MLQRLIVVARVDFGATNASQGVSRAAAMAWSTISYRRCSIQVPAKMLDSSNYGEILAPYG